MATELCKRQNILQVGDRDITLFEWYKSKWQLTVALATLLRYSDGRFGKITHNLIYFMAGSFFW